MTDQPTTDPELRRQLEAVINALGASEAESAKLRRRIETLEYVAAGNRRHVQLIVPELERAEAAIARVRKIRKLAAHDQPTGSDRALWAARKEAWNSALDTVHAALDEPGPDAGSCSVPDPRTEPNNHSPATAQAAEPGVDRQTALVLAALHHSAETTVFRVIDLYERWVKAGPPPLGTLMSRWWDTRLAELHTAINPKES